MKKYTLLLILFGALASFILSGASCENEQFITTTTSTSSTTTITTPATTSSTTTTSTTSTTTDTTPPSVVSVYPVNGATDVTRESMVSAQFSEALSTESISSGHFIITTLGQQVSYYSFIYDGATDTIKTTPYDLPPGHTFLARLTGIKDRANNPMPSDYTWSFTTTIEPYSWIDTYNAGLAANEGYGIAVDASGNIYVVGAISVTGEGRNIWVRKYDSSGGVLWTETFNGADNLDDIGKGVGVDGSGNVYVAGIENLSGGNANIWVRKYDSGGSTVWTKQIAAGLVLDFPSVDIAVDSSGNAYVVGKILNTYSYLWVRKLDTGGNTVWTNTDQKGSNGNGITVDGSGNVYTTASQSSAGNPSSINVCKFDSSGNLLWSKFVTGESAGATGGRGIAVDTDGAVYSVGTIWEDSRFKAWLGKHDSSGNLVWSKIKDYAPTQLAVASGIAIDGSHNLYVAGTANQRAWTRKFDNAGNELSVLGSRSSRIASINNNITLDSSYNIYLIGQESYFNKYAIWMGKLIP